MDPDLLEKLRRGLKLRMRASGALEIGGEPVTHPRIQAAIRNGLDVSDGGDPIMYLGDQWAYLEVEDAPFRVTAVEIDGATLRARLDDGRTVEVDPSTLVEDEALGLRCEVPARRSGKAMRARFTNRAQMDLAPQLETAGTGTTLRIAGQAFPIRTEM